MYGSVTVLSDVSCAITIPLLLCCIIGNHWSCHMLLLRLLVFEHERILSSFLPSFDPGNSEHLIRGGAGDDEKLPPGLPPTLRMFEHSRRAGSAIKFLDRPLQFIRDSLQGPSEDVCMKGHSELRVRLRWRSSWQRCATHLSGTTMQAKSLEKSAPRLQGFCQHLVGSIFILHPQISPYKLSEGFPYSHILQETRCFSQVYVSCMIKSAREGGRAGLAPGDPCDICPPT